MKETNIEQRIQMLLLISFLGMFIWSAINPRDIFVWFLEVMPTLIGLAVIFATYKRFPLTTLVYFLIWVDGIILVIGGHYTYAEMPLFEWFQVVFDLKRNYYDRLGHLAQGFVPAIIAREILIRKTLLSKGKMFNFIIVCICLAISAFYELIEWWVAIASGTAADAFLGTQGDVWDTQWDMFLALIGAIVALLTLPRLHDKALLKMSSR